MTSLRYIVRGALRGKSLGRLLMNDTLSPVLSHLTGRVLDLAGGESPSYLPLIPNTVELVRTNFGASAGVTAVDFNKPLPFSSETFDTVLLLNALYIAENPPVLMAEIWRVLKSDGQLLLFSPFIANEMPEPHDYVRFTAEGLQRLCANAGFHEVRITRIGERASAAAYLMHPFLRFNWIRAIVYPLALMFDRLIPARIHAEHPVPISYFVQCRKPVSGSISHI